MNAGYRKDVLLILLLSLLIYNINLRVIYRSSDALPAEYLPYSILTEGDLDLNEFSQLYENPNITQEYPPKPVGAIRGETLYRLHYSIGLLQGNYFSLYPIGSSLLATPLYVIPVFLLNIPPDSWMIPYLAKFSATVFCTLSSLFLYLAIAELYSRKTAFHLSLAYAFATHTLSVASQDLWQHAATQMLLALTLLLLLKAQKDKRFVPLSGILLSLSVFVRPTNAIFAFFFILYMFHKHRNHFLKLLAYLAPISLALAYYNLHYFNTLLGGYRFVEEFEHGVGSYLNFFNPVGLVGVLVSFDRGIFFYSPFLVYALWGIRRAWRKNMLFPYAALACGAYVYFTSTLTDWWGGVSFGYRVLLDMLPFMVFFIAEVYDVITADLGHRVIFTVLVAASVFVQLVGFLLYDAGDVTSVPPITTLEESQLYYYLHDIRPIVCTPDWTAGNISCRKTRLFSGEEDV